MSATGPAPKPPEQRRRYNQPAQSEWIDLPEELDKPILPAYRPSFTIPKEFWELWRKDTITTQYHDVDVAAAVDLAKQWALLPPAEQRLRYTALGVTPAGRRSLRWRTQLEAKQQREATAKVKKLRLVSKE